MFKTLMRDDVLNNGKQMKDVWNLNHTKPNKKNMKNIHSKTNICSRKNCISINLRR